MNKKIKLFAPCISKKELLNLKSVLKSGTWASGEGSPFVNLFEKKIQKYLSSKCCIAVNSGTAALHLALSILNITKKEVILPSLSFVSTAHAVLYNGGKPVFVDVDPNTLCIDPEEAAEKINKNTKLILPVHFAGIPANIRKLQKISRDNDTLLVDDAAHAMGATYNKKKIGSVCDATCFSFHPVKNLAMPNGGMISLNHPFFHKMKQIIKSKRWCGITDRVGTEYNVKEIGWNYYMNEFSAAIGLAQLESLDKLNKKRRETAKRYFDEINLDEKMPYNNDTVYHFYWILVKNRNYFRKKLTEARIETGTHYNPIHKFTLYRNGINLPVTEKISKEIVTIPTHPNLAEGDVDQIIKLVNKFS